MHTHTGGFQTRVWGLLGHLQKTEKNILQCVFFKVNYY